MNKSKVLAIVGQTASGKTSLSIELAQYFDGEVVSCDSRQVYRGLDIGTGKVTESEMAGVPHHVLDMVAVTETYTATDFTRDAQEAIDVIVGRNKVPIVAGGTFFYLDQLRGKSLGPDVPPNEDLRSELESKSAAELFSILQQKDPRRARSVDSRNKRRLIRALEIVDAIGLVPESTERAPTYDWLIIGIERDKASLRRRYRRRAESWLTDGILDETRWLKNQVSIDRFGEFGFEYILSDRLLNGEITQTEFVERFIQKNWQYAKRQMAWLKRDTDIKWFAPAETTRIQKRVQDFLQDPS